MNSAPRLGLLLDVDGPIASPVSRTVAIPSIARDLVTLANRGVPIAFNTGRSDAFLREQLVPQLLAAGLADETQVWAICEKGAVVARIGATGIGEIEIDDELAMPRGYAEAVRSLVETRYADLVFFDDTKRAMVSVEQLVDVPADEYASRRGDFDADAASALEEHGLGYEWNDRTRPDDSGAAPYRIDPTIISTDIESVRSGKDLGASKLLKRLEADGAALPLEWRTLGDSRTDYAMADWLHDHGFTVAHVDVRPEDGVPSTDYPVRFHPELVHDDAGALYLSRWIAMLDDEQLNDSDLG